MSSNHSVKTRSQARKTKSWREVMDNHKDDLFFFSKDSMDLFGSVLVGTPYTLPYDFRTYFVTGEDTFDRAKKEYTIRVIDTQTGVIEKISEHGQYKTPMEAIAARNAIVGYE